MKGTWKTSSRLRPLMLALALGIGAVGYMAAGAGSAALAAGNGHGGGNGGGNGGGGNSGGHGGGSGSHGNGSGHADASASGSAHAASNADVALDPKAVDGIVAVVAPAQLKSLNAAHASATALAHAAPNSTVGRIATYQRERLAALAITNPALQAAAIATAEANLENSFHRTLTAAQIDQINALLDNKSP